MAAANHKIAARYFLKGYIVLRSGLTIGGTDAGLGVSGSERVVIRNPITFMPYIPGSTLKGRMRSLMERLAGEFGTFPQGNLGAPLKKAETPVGELVCDLFGTATDDRSALPARLTIRDAQLLNGKALADNRNLDLPYTEVKSEAAIDRLTAKATPHFNERVPAGAVFALDLVITTYEPGQNAEGETADDAARLLKGVFTGMRLVADDALGASGSRGYGKVAFHVASVTRLTADAYLNGADAEAVADVPVPADLTLQDAEVSAVEAQF